MVRMIRWKRFQLDALSTSLVFAILACFFTALATGSITRFIFQWITPDANGSKADTQISASVALPLSFLFSTLAMLNISLVWIEIADNAQSLRRTSSNIQRYRNALIVYYIIFLSLIILSLALGSITIATAVALPGLLFVIVTYIVGFVKMRRMLKAYLIASENTPEVKNGSSSNLNGPRKIRSSLKAISYAAIGVSFWALACIVWVVAWVLLGGLANQPLKNFNMVAEAISWFCAAFGDSTTMWYINFAIVNKGKYIVNQSNEKLSAQVVAVVVASEHNNLPVSMPSTGVQPRNVLDNNKVVEADLTMSEQDPASINPEIRKEDNGTTSKPVKDS